jgi:acetyl esterase/lipase
MNLLIFILLLVLILGAIELFYLRGGPTTEYPAPTDPDADRRFESGPESSRQQQAVENTVEDLISQISSAVRNHRLREARAVFDSISDGRDYVSEFLPVDAGGVPAEWVIAPGADSSRRVLYIHGGGFIMGGPKSHRTMTSKFSEVSGSCVLAIDYRLMPENRHMDCVEDCRTAYRWVLENGPDGPGEIRQLFFAGDSAGGNLSLSLAAWVRDHDLRAPDAVVALSPLTDITFSGASVSDNESTDIMLKPMMGILNKLPQFLKSWWVVWTYKVRPANPVASPLLGNLSGLPPTLVQASASEMLLDDSRRYVYKACASGSPAKLQTWSNMVHVWQIFEPHLPQANEAWQEIGRFIETVACEATHSS